jgi:predicted AlkP superfamily phosphohydrolase/phosphomutase
VPDPLTGRVVVLGLDGATWDLLRPLADQGVMPNLGRALERGARGRLRSCLPPYSAPAWTTIATGTNPGRHGIFDFWEAAGPGERRPVSARSARGSRLWDVASAAGRRVHVVNVPVSYPPAQVNGSFVSGMMTPGEGAPYTHPPELKAALKALPGGYEADPYAAGLTGRPFIEQTHHWIRQKERAVQHLLRDGAWDLLFTVIQAPDPLQHKFWSVLDPDDPRHDRERARELLPALHEAYRRCDEVLGARMALAEHGALLLVISDHGFGRYEKLLYVNRVLQDAGLLVRSGPARRRSSRLSARRVIALARRLDVLGVEGRLPTAAKERLARRVDRALAPPVDWSETVAYAGSGSGECVFVAGHVPAREREHVARRAIEALCSVRDPDTGAPVLEGAYRREELYRGSELARLPDVLIDFGERPYLASDRLAVPDLFEPLPLDAGGGRHRRNGILLALGPDVDPCDLPDADIADVCPTVLHALDLPVPEGLDGRVLERLVGAERPVRTASPPAEAEPEAEQAAYSAEEAAAIDASLRGIGYL